MFFISSIVLFLGGIFVLQYPVWVIPFVLIALLYLCTDYEKTYREINKKIEGEGVPKITVSDKAPVHPKEGEIWIDKSKLH